MYLISTEGYKNAGVHFSRVNQTGEIWPRMKDVHKGLSVKNMSNLVLKKYTAFMKQKTLQINKLKNTKLVKKTFLKNMLI